MRTAMFLASVILSFLLGGCHVGQRLKDPATLPLTQGELRWEQSLCDQLRAPRTRLDDEFKSYYAEGVDGNKLKSIRDGYARRILGLIDEYHDRYRMQLHMDIASGATGFDFAQLGLSFATTVVGGATTKSVLGAVNTMVTGAELSIRQNFLNDQAMLTILSQMDADRAKRRLEINQALNRSGDDRYPLEAVRNDLLLYFHDGSLVTALLSVSKKTAETAEKNQRALIETTSVRYDSGSTRKLRDAIGTWVDQDPEANMAKLKNWRQKILPAYDGLMTAWIEDASVSEFELRGAMTALGIPAPKEGASSPTPPQGAPHNP